MKEHSVFRQFRFDALGDPQDMPTHRCGVDASSDRQDIGQELGRGRIRNERGPARLQIKPLRRDVIGNEFHERRRGGASVSFSAWAAVKSRARQPHVAKQSAKYNRVAALASPPAAANFAAPSPLYPALGLSFDNPLLGGGKQNLALGERQSLWNRLDLTPGTEQSLPLDPP